MSTTHNRIRRVGLILALASATLAPAAIAAVQFTSDFNVESCKFEPNGRQNPYFSLNPGDQLTLEGEEDGKAARVEVTVENQTQRITFTTPGGTAMSLLARVVVEKEWIDGEIVEVATNWLSRCRQTQDVFYFGESVDNYEHGQVANHDGSWEAGVGGAQPGILIPARFLLGSRYYQEQAPGVAFDRIENVDMGFKVKAAGKTFRDCVAVSETSQLDPGSESLKVYCPGIGLVMDDEFTLTAYRRN
ncbi:MAG: hypothetical protein QOF89_69 [Acidobacteriota bacterium]|jgi:hypothetical protein|nr:hypothetical protein [Acidobacteriota bacterium]